MAMETAADVLICGAGAAGLVLAIDLARRGVSFRLIDKIDEPFGGSRGKGIQPRSQEIFEDLGVLDRLVAVGGMYPPQRKHRDDGGFTEIPVTEHVDPTPAEPYHLALMVPQYLTEGVLRDRLAETGHKPDYGCELVGLEQDGKRVNARIRHNEREETMRARFLVGSDGGRSFVRHALDVGFEGKSLQARSIVADVRLTGLDRDAWHMYRRTEAEQLSICPLAGTDLFQLQAPIPLESEPDLSLGGLEAMVKQRTGRDDIAITQANWSSSYTMSARLADRYRIGRVFLAGDAAHIHPPTGGQGLNTSIQDAYNLGWKLGAVLGGAPDRLLDSYEAERRPVAAGMLGLATKLLDELKHGEMRRGRDVVQLDIGYPHSPLLLEEPARTGGLRGGDRAPDAPLQGAAGQARRLFEIFQGAHWTLIGYETGDCHPPARKGLNIHRIGAGRELVDVWSHFSEAYGLAAGEWALIRPDGYVGAIVGETEMALLEEYLQKVGLTA
ncbi:FAD-dependent oxidoreductase [Hoeflea sp. WL0058]|uniref:FAD-dependent oxidoreductase n=1 Tax=Flavimaribacter sediminis TaxID=2865987 RepID=A0AAE3D1H5_9HYPH|nr:FAD-dependent oxidoreductase [Flavimaribacter sediminis]